MNGSVQWHAAKKTASSIDLAQNKSTAEPRSVEAGGKRGTCGAREGRGAQATCVHGHPAACGDTRPRITSKVLPLDAGDGDRNLLRADEVRGAGSKHRKHVLRSPQRNESDAAPPAGGAKAGHQAEEHVAELAEVAPQAAEAIDAQRVEVRNGQHAGGI